MLLFVSFALIIVLLCLYIHYQNHFHLTNREKKTAKNTPRSVNARKRGCCCISFKTAEEFDFFPTSFLFYMFFVVFLCILTVIVEILYIVIDSESNLGVILFSLSFVSYYQHSIDEIHDLSLHSYDIYIICVYIIDLILIYGIMILSIWESLFSFYRYYTTVLSAEYLTMPSVKQIVQIYAIYAILFIVIFVIEIHLYYYMFPLVVLCHFGFNCYCTSRFSSILLNKYDVTENGSTEIKDELKHSRIVKSVHFVRKSSIISYVVQSIYLSAFLITYNVNTIYYLPLFWSVSCFIFTINFIRNRVYLHQKYINLRRFVCCQMNTKQSKPRSDSLLTDDGNSDKVEFTNQIQIVADADAQSLQLSNKTVTDSNDLRVLDELGVTTPDPFDANDTDTSKYKMKKILTSVSEQIFNTSVGKENTKIKLENNKSDHIVLCKIKKPKTMQPKVKLPFMDGTTSSSPTVAKTSKFKSFSCHSNPVLCYKEEMTEATLAYCSSMPVKGNTKTNGSIGTQIDENKVKQRKDIDIQSLHSGFNFVDTEYEMDSEHNDDAEFNMIQETDDDEEPL